MKIKFKYKRMSPFKIISFYIRLTAAKSFQSCPTLCDPIDGSPPGSPVPWSLQAGTLEWVAISFTNAWKWSRSVMSDSQRPHGLQPTRLLHPWDFPGKSTGVGCHRETAKYWACKEPKHATCYISDVLKNVYQIIVHMKVILNTLFFSTHFLFWQIFLNIGPTSFFLSFFLSFVFISHMILYMFQCHYPKSSLPFPLPQSPKDYSRHLCLFCCLSCKVIITIFLNSIYMH